MVLPTVKFGPPAVESLLRDTDAMDSLDNGTARGDDHLRLPELVDDFLSCVFPLGHVSSPVLTGMLTSILDLFPGAGQCAAIPLWRSSTSEKGTNRRSSRSRATLGSSAPRQWFGDPGVRGGVLSSPVRLQEPHPRALPASLSRLCSRAGDCHRSD